MTIANYTPDHPKLEITPASVLICYVSLLKSVKHLQLALAEGLTGRDNKYEKKTITALKHLLRPYNTILK